jgi:hypothetical protein
MTAYEYSIVSFFDIFGFRSLVEEKDAGDVSKILDLLAWVGKAGLDADADAYAPRVVAFSDSIVRAVNIHSEANKKHPIGLLFSELISILWAQMNMIYKGYFVRGAITIGNVAITSTQVFGPAFIEAHELESQVARYPRIIVSPRALRCLDTCDILIKEGHSIPIEKGYVKRLLKEGDDGIWFIDYLNASRSEVDDDQEYFDYICQHRDAIKTLYEKEGSSSTRAYVCNWLAEYHNRTIDGLHRDWISSFGVSREELRVSSADVKTMYKFGRNVVNPDAIPRKRTKTVRRHPRAVKEGQVKIRHLR